MSRFVPATLRHVGDRYSAITGRAFVGATFSGVVLAWVVALLVAREGTAAMRIVAAITIAATGAAGGLWIGVRNLSLRGSRGIVARVARPIDPAIAARVTRALTLLGADGTATAEGASPELAALHVSRAVERIGIDRVVARAERSATVAAIVGLILGASALGLAATYGRPVFEGADVLLAVRSKAPIAVSWLDDVDVTLRMPEYLHGEETALSGIAQTIAVPYGTTITIRGFARFRGRRLVLAVGASEIAFAPDGSGAWTAHALAAENGTIRVGARFGTSSSSSGRR